MNSAPGLRQAPASAPRRKRVSGHTQVSARPSSCGVQATPASRRCKTASDTGAASVCAGVGTNHAVRDCDCRAAVPSVYPGARALPFRAPSIWPSGMTHASSSPAACSAARARHAGPYRPQAGNRAIASETRPARSWRASIARQGGGGGSRSSPCSSPARSASRAACSSRAARRSASSDACSLRQAQLGDLLRGMQGGACQGCRRTAWPSSSPSDSSTGAACGRCNWCNWSTWVCHAASRSRACSTAASARARSSAADWRHQALVAGFLLPGMGLRCLVDAVAMLHHQRDVLAPVRDGLA